MNEENANFLKVIHTDMMLDDVRTVRNNVNSKGYDVDDEEVKNTYNIVGVTIREWRRPVRGNWYYSITDEAHAIVQEHFELTSSGKVVLHPKVEDYQELLNSVLRNVGIYLGRTIRVLEEEPLKKIGLVETSHPCKGERFIEIDVHWVVLLLRGRSFPPSDKWERRLLVDLAYHLRDDTYGMDPLLRQIDDAEADLDADRTEFVNIMNDAGEEELGIQLDVVDNPPEEASTSRTESTEGIDLGALREVLRHFPYLDFQSGQGDDIIKCQNYLGRKEGSKVALNDMVVGRGEETFEMMKRFLEVVDEESEGLKYDMVELNEKLNSSTETAEFRVVDILTSSENKPLGGTCPTCRPGAPKSSLPFVSWRSLKPPRPASWSRARSLRRERSQA